MSHAPEMVGDAVRFGEAAHLDDVAGHAIQATGEVVLSGALDAASAAPDGHDSEAVASPPRAVPVDPARVTAWADGLVLITAPVGADLEAIVSGCIAARTWCVAAETEDPRVLSERFETLKAEAAAKHEPPEKVLRRFESESTGAAAWPVRLPRGVKVHHTAGRVAPR